MMANTNFIQNNAYYQNKQNHSLFSDNLKSLEESANRPKREADESTREEDN